MAISPRNIPPSPGTKESIKNAKATSPRSGNKRRKSVNPHSSSWLWLNGVCLFINIGLMVTLFGFHAYWMPHQTNMVIKSHIKNRKELWKLMSAQRKGGLGKPGASKEEEGAAAVGADALTEEELGGGSLKNPEEGSSQAKELPYTLGNSPNDDDYDMSKQQYHVIFSTGCSAKQHWQSYMLFYSMVTSEQTGQITRIASGCSEEEAAELEEIHKVQIEPMGMDMPYKGKSRFNLHMTPEFGSGFHYNNKPYGVAHWMEHVLGYSEAKDVWSTNHDDTILFLLDPDMIMMRPFVNDFSHTEKWLPRKSYPQVDRIKHGYPMASVYLYGNQWYYKTNITAIVGKSPCTSYTKQQIDENYHAGPPYVATAKDFYNIVTTWRMLAQPVHEQYPYLLSEMFAYSLAAAHLELPHQLAQSFMVSDWKEPGLELITKNPNVKPEQMCRNVPKETKPHVLHYCQRLALGKYIMSKHRLPDDFVGQDVSCAKPLLMEPPDDAAVRYDYFVDIASGERHDIRTSKNGFKQQDKINEAAFMLCEELQHFNRGATYFKQHNCKADEANFQKTFSFFDNMELSDAEKAQKGTVV